MDIDIIIVNYNGYFFISETIDSLLAQTSDKFHIYLCDDASDDGSTDLIRDSYSGASNITCILNESTTGFGNCLNNVIKESKNDIIGIVYVSDTLEKDAVEKVIEYYTNNDCEFLYTQCNLYNEQYCFLRRGGNKDVSGYTIPQRLGIGQWLTFKRNAYVKTEGFYTDSYYDILDDIGCKLEEVTKPHFMDIPLYNTANIKPKFLYGKINPAPHKIIRKRAWARRMQAYDPNYKGKFGLISFCITCYNRSKTTYDNDEKEYHYLPDCIDSIIATCKQLNVDFEIIVSDWNSTDLPLKEWMPVKCKAANVPFKIVNVDGVFNAGMGRNVAYEHSNGEIIFFMDTDMLLSVNVLSDGLSDVKKGYVAYPQCRQDNVDKRISDGHGNIIISRDNHIKIGRWDEFPWRGGEDLLYYQRSTFEKIPITRRGYKDFIHQWHPRGMGWKHQQTPHNLVNAETHRYRNGY